MKGHGAGVVALVLGATLLAPAAAGADGLARAIDAILDRPALAAGSWGADVRELPGGRPLYSRHAGQSLAPASALKLVVTAAALDVLGPQTRIETTVWTAARLDRHGRLLGDVYLVGGGDPTLGASVLEDMAEALQVAGVRHIEGRLVGHEGLFAGERRGPGWTWEDLVWGYGAEVSALTLSDNSAELVVSPGEEPSDPLRVERSPRTSYFVVENRAATSPAGAAPALELRRAAGSNRLELSGSLPLGSPPETLRVALEDPARFAATVFAEALGRRGIEVAGGVGTSSAPLPPGVWALASHDSAPLRDLVRGVNKPSNNLHAEVLLRLLGRRAGGDGSREAAGGAVRAFLDRLGVDLRGWDVRGGSGLDRSDLVTARGLVDLLVAMDRHPQAAVFRESLPVAGVDGTLRSRLGGTPAASRVRAKTGTLRHVHALAGYVETRRGRRLAFALLGDRHTAAPAEVVAALDAVAALLAAR